MAKAYFGCMVKWPGVALVLGLGFSFLTVASAAGRSSRRAPGASLGCRLATGVEQHQNAGAVNEVSGELTGIRNYPAVGTIGVNRTVCS